MDLQLRRTFETEGLFGVVRRIKHLVFAPIRVALSRPAQKAYVTAILAVFAAFALLATAIIGYALFYWSYVPLVAFERPIHLQFDHVYDHATIAQNAHPFPYGTILLSPDLAGSQAYDVVVELTLPRTTANTEAGNFMLEAAMFTPNDKNSPFQDTTPLFNAIRDGTSDSSVVARSRRPAILPYRSRVVESVHRALQLHWYVLGWRHEEDKIRVTIFENVHIGRGRRNVPSAMSIEIQSTHRLRVYSAKAMFRARFRGIRWLMYNHRIISAAIFIPGFWVTELIFAGVAWAGIVMFVLTPIDEDRQRPNDGKEVVEDSDENASVKIEKKEEEDALGPVLSDTERVFPTTYGKPILKYSSPEVKREDGGLSTPLTSVPTLSPAIDADDEDDDEDFFIDSGIGTSLESSGPSRRDSVRKRRGRMTSRDRM